MSEFLYILLPINLISIGIYAGVIITGLIFVLSGSQEKKHNRICSACTPSRNDTLTGYTRPRQWYHINLKHIKKDKDILV